MERIISINPSDINTNFKQNLLNTLRNEVEGKCNSEGYIEKGSVEIIDSGNLYTEVIRYRGHVRVKVIFTGKVVNPTKDDIIECKIKRYNQFGIMAISGPLNIVIPFDDKHKNTNFNIGQSLKVKIVESELILNSDQINVCATFFDEIMNVNSKEIKSLHRNVNKNKNKDDTKNIALVGVDKTDSKKLNVDEGDEGDEGDEDDEGDEGDEDDEDDSESSDESDKGEGEYEDEEDKEPNNKRVAKGEVDGDEIEGDGILPEEDDDEKGSVHGTTDDDGSEANSDDDDDDGDE